MGFLNWYQALKRHQDIERRVFMHKVTFHNIGCADCIRIDLDNGKKLLFDYADMRDPNDEDDKRCDLPRVLRDDLDDRDDFDVVAFTHLDRDHYCGATDFFYFDHIEKYQDDVNGEPRIKMLEMWVPAAVITEELSGEGKVEAKAIQTEARRRFKAKSGIRVFSGPKRLRDWCDRTPGVEYDEALVTDAGELIPGYSLEDDEAEFFVHSPFATRQDVCDAEDRNIDSLVVHVSFVASGTMTRLFLASDVDHAVLTDIVTETERKKNGDRLEWDIFKLPHHCNHGALSSQDRTGNKSKPEPKVKRLFEHYRQDNCIVVSTSDPIPARGSKRDAPSANPPHRQAANYYREDVVADADDFKVTMEHPSEAKPSPLAIQIDRYGATVKRIRQVAAVTAATTRPPRAG